MAEWSDKFYGLLERFAVVYGYGWQGFLSKKSGVPQNTISQIYNKRCGPTAKTLDKLVNALNEVDNEVAKKR